ncbi:Hypothetical predicted protein [Pelobates cultripes]|uniref:Sodium channel modifier 1 acidic C-terminal domain-containing protein n=1 Tax=Pelobates cultripes TaxID=61616 RepID=A0AAD1WUN8_PELCU|nr:Hypothetical predicted protein [Pelobates cultripes]
MPRLGARVGGMPRLGARVGGMPRLGARVGGMPRLGARVGGMPRLGACVPRRDAPARRLCRRDAPARRSCRRDAPARRSCRRDAPARRSCRRDAPARRSCRRDAPAQHLHGARPFIKLSSNVVILPFFLLCSPLIQGLQWFYGKKNNFKNEVQKRQHERFVRAEETGEQMPIGPAPLLMQTRKITQHALLKATPYNSCCSRNRSADTSRKISAFGASPAPDTVPNLPQRTTETSQPGQGDRSLDVEKQTTECPKPSTGHKKSGAKRSESEADSTDPERTRAIHHYLLLKSSGWIPNRSGQWVKDPNVEFDSDEEEPPVLPHPDT